MHQQLSMRTFVILWLGQFVSLIGSGATQFALALWIWEQTGEVMPVMVTTVCFFLPNVIFSPIVGALVDRLNRKALMLCCDGAAGLTVLVLFVLASTGQLQVWHLYISAFLSGIYQTIQLPALQASVTLLVPPAQYNRAAGLLGIADVFGQILAPVLAALLFGTVGLAGIFILDLASFVLAITALLFVSMPLPAVFRDETRRSPSIFDEMCEGLRYMLSSKKVLLMIGFYFCFNIAVEAWASLLSPLVLARTDGDALTLSAIQAAGGLAAILAGIAVSVLPSPRYLMKRLLLCLGAMGILTLPITLHGQPMLWMAAHFAFFGLHTFFSASSYATWQKLVPPQLQGRVFATRKMVLSLPIILMPMVLGYSADHIFEPAMRVVTPSNEYLSAWVGSGSGAGMALLFAFSSLMMIALAVGGALSPSVRLLDQPERVSIPVKIKTGEFVRMNL
jgi:MFS transporter, DHA3 family, macrolide efflux protein